MLNSPIVATARDFGLILRVRRICFVAFVLVLRRFCGDFPCLDIGLLAAWRGVVRQLCRTTHVGRQLSVDSTVCLHPGSGQ